MLQMCLSLSFLFQLVVEQPTLLAYSLKNHPRALYRGTREASIFQTLKTKPGGQDLVMELKSAIGKLIGPTVTPQKGSQETKRLPDFIPMVLPRD